MHALPGGGGMRAVLAPEEQVATFLAAEPTLSIAAVNGPASTVVSGTLDALDRLSARPDAAGIPWRPHAVRHGVPSALLDPTPARPEAAGGRVEHRAHQRSQWRRYGQRSVSTG